MPELDADFIEAAIKRYDVWDLGNNVLYHLCGEHPCHRTDAEILAKFWLIGRAYAAAIERRRKYLQLSSDEFYEQKVGPEIRKANLDDLLKPLRSDAPNKTNIVLRAHKSLCNVLNCLSGLDKRSLASKYLHFHFPDCFFIYDARAYTAMQHLHRHLSKPRILHHNGPDVDREYAAFCDRCEDLRDYATDRFGLQLAPRDLDKVLLAWHAQLPRTANIRQHV